MDGSWSVVKNNRLKAKVRLSEHRMTFALDNFVTLKLSAGKKLLQRWVIKK